MSPSRTAILLAGLCLLFPHALTAQAVPDEELRVRLAAGDALLEGIAKAAGAPSLDGKRRVIIEIAPAPAVAAVVPPERGPGPALAPETPASSGPRIASSTRYQGERDVIKNQKIDTGRADQQPDMKLVIMAPGDAGFTQRDRPRLWWYQSEPSAPGELQFILTRMDEEPEELMRVDLGGLPKGYNSIDLASPMVNPDQEELAAGKTYQWTIALRGGDAGAAVFAKMKRVATPALPARDKDPAARLKALSDAGNWYELFDAVALMARRNPKREDLADARWQLLGDARIQEHLPGARSD